VVKKGGVHGLMSPVFFCVYIDNMLLASPQARIGCYIGNIFVGDLESERLYADNIVLIAHSPSAMRISY
jgi:hypothetical protein